MKSTLVLLTVLLAGTWLAARARAEQQMPPGCAKIVAVLDQGGGGLSADEIAKKTGTDVETVRGCTDLWRSTKKDAKAPTGAAAGHEAMPAGCAKVVAVLDQGGGGLSADEVAKKSSTDVETVRNCTDLWRRSMKSGANP
jgi:hypothetical protein